MELWFRVHGFPRRLHGVVGLILGHHASPRAEEVERGGLELRVLLSLDDLLRRGLGSDGRSDGRGRDGRGVLDDLQPRRRPRVARLLEPALQRRRRGSDGQRGAPVVLPLAPAAVVDARRRNVDFHRQYISLGGDVHLGLDARAHHPEVVLVLVLVLFVDVRGGSLRLGQRGLLLEPRGAFRGGGGGGFRLLRLSKSPRVFFPVPPVVVFNIGGVALRVKGVVAHRSLGHDPHPRRGDGLDGIRREPVRLRDVRVGRRFRASAAASSPSTPRPPAASAPAAPPANLHRSLLGHLRVRRRRRLLGDGLDRLRRGVRSASVSPRLDHRRR